MAGDSIVMGESLDLGRSWFVECISNYLLRDNSLIAIKSDSHSQVSETSNIPY